jgi:intermembrane space import and assembly protein 40
MQDCFRQHPETYASEFEDDEDEVEEELRARQVASSDEELPTPPSSVANDPEPSQQVTPESAESKPVEQPDRDSSHASADKLEKLADEGEELLPKAVHDARSK